MSSKKRLKSVIDSALKILFIWSILPLINVTPEAQAEYVLLAWNDLGMHCYNKSFQDLAILPPYNNLWAQVIEKGNPPRIVTISLTVTYAFPDNTYSVGKSNFWTYAQKLFGVALQPNIGLTGKGLSGTLDPKSDYFEASGIPLTEFSDSAPTVRYPYQLSNIVVKSSSSNAVLTQATVVAPVSTEMHCDNCHSDGGVEGISTGRVETNILTLHDEENMDEYPSGHQGALMSRRPVMCAECHSSNALSMPGVQGIPNFSNAMHRKHRERVTQDINGCYNCHPGPQTKCLRDVMSQSFGMDCVSCHGNMSTVSQNSSPWLNEPRCDSAQCHGSQYAQDKPLFRMSKGHAGIYCEGCHDSTHAIAPSREPNDAIKFVSLQGKTGTLRDCRVCHTVRPSGAGPHGIMATGAAPITPGIYVPLILN
jgi:hypothetical protein